MGIRKRIISVGLSVCLLTALLTGCQSHNAGKASGKIKIGVTLYDQYDTFISQLDQCFVDLVEDNVEVSVYNASQSQQTQDDQVKKMIEDGCSVICVNLVDRTDPTVVIDAARKANVPIIFFNRELVEADIGRWDKLYYVGADARQSGEMQGQLAARTCYNDRSVDKNKDGVIQYVVLEGEAGHQDAILRTEYAVDTLIKMGVEIDKLGYAIANWNRAQAQTKAAQMIEENGKNIELVLSNNDDMALGVMDAYEAAGIDRDEWPAIFGIDGTDVGLEAVRDDKMDGTVYNDKEDQAKAMYDLALILAGGGSIEDLSGEYNITEGKYIRIPYAKVTRANVDNFLNN